jgi:glycosyltransferase involved in cell wall biosynthesis
MRILMLNHVVAWRSRLARSFHWGRYLARKGHDVSILEISDTKRCGFDLSQQEGVTFIGSPDLFTGKPRSGWDPWDVLNRIAYVLPEKFDIVHAIDSRPVAILPALASKYFRTAKLFMDWGDWWGRGGAIHGRATSPLEYAFAPIETFFEEAFRRFADGSIVLSSALKERAISLGVDPDTILQTSSGSDVERIRPRDQYKARQRLGFKPDEKLIGYVGVLYKGDQDLLSQSFTLMCKMDPSIRLILIGRKSPKTLAIDPEFQQYVFRVGEVTFEDLLDYIAACDVMLLPLKDNIASRGRWPAKIGDYMASGKPVVATHVGDYATMIEEGRCGVLTDDTPYDFASQTVNIFCHRDRIKDMGQNARKVAETRLDWMLLTNKLEQFYVHILNTN